MLLRVGIDSLCLLAFVLDDFPVCAGPDELGRLALEGAARLYSSSDMSVAFNVVIVFCWSRK